MEDGTESNSSQRALGRFVPAAELPASMEHLSDVPELSEAWEEQVAERQAAAHKLNLLLAYRQRCRNESEAAGESMVQRAEAERAAVRDAAVMLGHAEQTTAEMLNAAEFCRDELPLCWRAFQRGWLDLARLRKIVTVASGIVADENMMALDEAAAEYAGSQNLGRLGSWLNRFLSSLDADEFQIRCRRAREERCVRFFHRDDGMTQVEALIPTLTATAIENRLRAAARSMDSLITHPGEPQDASAVSAPPSEDQMPPSAPLPNSEGSNAQAASAEALRTDSSAVDALDAEAFASVFTQAAGFGDPDVGRLQDPATVEGAPGSEAAAAADVEGKSEREGEGVESRPESRWGGDPRTIAQREADLFAAWLADGRVEGAAVDAKIAVMIPESTLTGQSNAPGVSTDRRWALPAEDARNLAADPRARHDWYTCIYQHAGTDYEELDGSHLGSAHVLPPGGLPPDRIAPDDPLVPENLLSISYQGHDPPRQLRDSLGFRDGTCQAPGCMVPAERCDMDHQDPWPDGATTATNLWNLCRRHHRMKGHGHLDPPSKTSTPVD